MTKLISSSFLVTAVILGIFLVSSIFTRQAIRVTIPAIIVLIWLCGFFSKELDRGIYELSLAVTGIAFLVAFGIDLTGFFWPVISLRNLPVLITLLITFLILLLLLICFIKIAYIDELEVAGLDKYGTESILAIQGVIIYFLFFLFSSLMSA